MKGLTAFMRIDGLWSLCDGRLLPVIRAEVRAGDGSWQKVDFIVDTGADRTVLSAEIMEHLQLDGVEAEQQLSGVGGQAHTVTVATTIRFDYGVKLKAPFHGKFAAFTQYETLELSVLGRDILNHFALIVDRKTEIVCLLGPPHRYVVE